MPRLSFLEQPIKQINIAQLAVPEATQPNEKLFDPERDLTERVIHDLYRKLVGEVQTGNYNDALRWALQLQLLFPSGDWRGKLTTHQLESLEKHVENLVFSNLSAAAGAHILFPGMMPNTVWDRIPASRTRIYDNISNIDYMEFDEDEITVTLDDLFYLCLLSYTEVDGLRSEALLKKKLQEFASFALKSGDGDGWRLGLAATLHKLIYNEDIVTSAGWKLLFTTLREFTSKQFYQLTLGQSLRMKVLVAGEAYFSPMGITFEEKNTRITESTTQAPPTQRNF